MNWILVRFCSLKRILRMNILFPKQWPAVISGSIKSGLNDLQINQVPLHSPNEGLMFLNKMIAQLSFKRSKCGRILFGVK